MKTEIKGKEYILADYKVSFWGVRCYLSSSENNYLWGINWFHEKLISLAVWFHDTMVAITTFVNPNFRSQGFRFTILKDYTGDEELTVKRPYFTNAITVEDK